MMYYKYEHQKRIPKCGYVNMNKILNNGGYYDVNNNWNSIIKVEGYDNKVFRGRVEVFLFKDNKVYMNISNNKYRIPGGSFDIKRSNRDQVFNEIKEEAKILSKNICYTGLSYVNIFNHYNKPTKTMMSWNGNYNEVYLAEYNKQYDGFVKNSVYDCNMHNNGGFYNIEDILYILKPEHLMALKLANII